MEANELEDVDVSASQLRAAGVTEENYFISAVESEIVRNTTNTEIDPTKGSVSSFHFEVASGILGSEVSYFKPTLRLIKYYPLFRGVVLGGRLRLRAIQETEDTHDIPIFKRLFLGGSNSVRGYGFQKLGPVDEGGTPIGGLSAMDANLEIRYPVFRKLSGVVFLDMGLVDETAFTYKLNRLRYSCGVGLRYMTVVGPIRLDFGYKLNPPTIRDFGKPTFPDEEIEDRWKIHLSVGQAF